ncbi:hypothetical protein BDBG_17340 [Blastomyces gilchristii SLH14081]|uniref:Uncharacterized protein n=1 Tax=Blastomyces gilchristii (strain SLH14081) TaxID=559298 RepID=A0A179UT93_BLAGS|nr:uncharacterized protein BDBG_17340 [Blastomyces gilchristii SLH14081]OAT10277.1 hypothetical protein BDBG_17340 [Blastomyces gilchristii SLH14081]
MHVVVVPSHVNLARNVNGGMDSTSCAKIVQGLSAFKSNRDRNARYRVTKHNRAGSLYRKLPNHSPRFCFAH